MTKRFQDLRRTFNQTDASLSNQIEKPALNRIFIGVVKDNRDVERMGRLRVFIPELGGNPSDESKWFTVQYCSPFAGATNPLTTIKDSTQYTGSQQSYGFWAVPPDLENLVVVCFINGEPNKGVWLGCLYQTNMNYMTPGMPAGKSYSDKVINGEKIQPPVVEYNKRNTSINYLDPIRPEFTPFSRQLEIQGLFGDPERGAGNSSSRRESPSQVFGIKTPRGHQIFIDDGEIEVDQNGKPVTENQEIKRKNYSKEFIRLRTRHGVQILINDTTGYIYLNTKNGDTWLELSDQNGVEIFTERNLNFHSRGEINFHSDTGVNIFSGGDLNLFSNGNTNIKTNNLVLNSNDNFLSFKKLQLNGDKIEIKASNNVFLVGSRIGLNGKILMNTVDSPETKKIELKTQNIGGQETIVGVLPTREPWAGHPVTLTAPSREEKIQGDLQRSRGSIKSSDHTISKSVSQTTDEKVIIDDCLTSISSKYESNNNPGAIGFDSSGGYSYGSVQIASNVGSMGSFLKYLEKENPEMYKELIEAGGEKGAISGTTQFKNKWREIAQRNPQEFSRLQKEWNYKANGQMAENYLKSQGIDIENKPTLRASLYSLSTQHGPAGAVRVIKSATSDLSNDQIKNLRDEDLINRLYDERARKNPDGSMKYFSRLDNRTQNAVDNRLKRERMDAMKMLEMEKRGELPCQKK